MEQKIKIRLKVGGLFLVVMVQLLNPAVANWNNGGCNDWPEWTPMYWMGKMMGTDNDCDTKRSYYQGMNAGYTQSALQQSRVYPMQSTLSQSTYGIPYSALRSGVNGNEILSQYPMAVFRGNSNQAYQKKRVAMQGYGYPSGRSMPYSEGFQSYPRWSNNMGGKHFGSMGSRFPMMGQNNKGMPMGMGGFGSPMSPMGFGSPMSPMGFGSPMSPMGFGSPMSPMGFGSPMSPMGMSSPMSSLGGSRGFSPFSGGGRGMSMPFF